MVAYKYASDELSFNTLTSIYVIILYFIGSLELIENY